MSPILSERREKIEEEIFEKNVHSKLRIQKSHALVFTHIHLQKRPFVPWGHLCVSSDSSITEGY
jgi:hypothetical protein